VRGDKLLARTRDHSYCELQETLAQVLPLSERVNRNVLFTCLGSPGKPVVDSAGPVPMCARRPAAAVLRRPVGHGARRRSSPPSWQTSRSPTRCPNWSSARCARRCPQRQRHRAGVEWESAEDADSRSGVSTQRSATRFSPPPSRPACWEPNPPDELDDAEIERSIREINDAIQRSSQRKRR
jgi:PPM family protein phosphatase